MHVAHHPTSPDSGSHEDQFAWLDDINLENVFHVDYLDEARDLLEDLLDTSYHRDDILKILTKGESDPELAKLYFLRHFAAGEVRESMQRVLDDDVEASDLENTVNRFFPDRSSQVPKWMLTDLSGMTQDEAVLETAEIIVDIFSFGNIGQQHRVNQLLELVNGPGEFIRVAKFIKKALSTKSYKTLQEAMKKITKALHPELFRGAKEIKKASERPLERVTGRKRSRTRVQTPADRYTQHAKPVTGSDEINRLINKIQGSK